MPPSLAIPQPRTDVASQVLVVTGMHRSGTSLVSSLLQAAGVHVGENLIAANVANPRGYFEDVDFYEYHEHLLHARGQSFLYAEGQAGTFEPTPEELQQAVQLIAGRMQHRIWGWKDPRTALFLDFWRQLLPQARFVFVYRHPLDVLLSLLRRGEFDEHPNLSAGVRAWCDYNQRIVEFYDQHADDCLLVHIDGVVSQVEHFSELVQGKLNVSLSMESETFARIYHAEELCHGPLATEANAVLGHVYPNALNLYHRLNACADIPAAFGANDQKQTPTQERLARLAANVALSPPNGEAERQATLQLLVAAILPERTDEMLQKFNENGKGLQQKVDMHWLYAQQLERNNKAQSQLLQLREQELSAQRSESAALTAQLTSQAVSNALQINEFSANLAVRDLSIDSQSKQLAEQQAIIDSQGQRSAAQQSIIDSQGQRLAALQSDVATQVNQLATQAAWLESQDAQIVEQDRMLREPSSQIGWMQAELGRFHESLLGKTARLPRRAVERIRRPAPVSTKSYQGGLASPIQGSMTERIAQVRELQSELHTRPVTGSLRGLKKMVFQTIRSTFSRQFTLNSVTVDLIESLHREVERLKPRLESQTLEMQQQALTLLPPQHIEQQIATGVVKASCGLTQDQAQLNNIRPLHGFNFVYTSPAEMRMPERVVLYGLIFGLQPKNCLEIGTFRGGSSAIIFGALDDTGAGQLACVDPNPQVEPELWGRLAKRCRMFPGSSPDILPEIVRQTGGKFDFALIDGDHPYESVKRDLEGVLDVLTDDAYVLFHDAHSPGVKRAVDEAISAHPTLTDCGMISVEPTILVEQGETKTWAGLRLIRFQAHRSN